mgnify:FL=1
MNRHARGNNEVACSCRLFHNRYHVCAPQPAAPSAVRAWIDKRAGGGPSYGPTTDPPPQQLTRRQINDRWNQHTHECTACQAALAGLKRQAMAFAAVAFALVAALSGAVAGAGLPRLLAGGAPAAAAAAAAGGACLAAALAWRAWRILPQFD